MKLNYNVLCIDDNLRSLARNKANFSQVNGDVGIDVNYRDIDAAARPDEVDRTEYVKRISDDINRAFEESSYDIILIDLHLNNNVEGHELIEFIRENHTIYRPVVFYSAGTPETEDQARIQLADAAQKGGIFGKNILITPRRQIDATLSKIAGEMHDEEQKINQVRGLLMDRVSELDANIIRAVNIDAVWAALGEEQKKALHDYVQSELVEGRFKSQKKSYEALKAMDLEGIKKLIFENPKALDTYTKTRILKKILSLVAGMEENATTLAEILAKGGLNDIRNNYAHKTAEELNDGHTSEQCIEIRNTARKQLTNINAVLANFQAR